MTEAILLTCILIMLFCIFTINISYLAYKTRKSISETVEVPDND